MGDFRYALLAFVGAVFTGLGFMFLALDYDRFWVAAKPMFLTAFGAGLGMLYIRFIEKEEYLSPEEINKKTV